MLRGLAHVSAVLALAVLGLALGRWLSDPDLGGPLLVLSVLALVVAVALRWLYGPGGIAALHPVADVTARDPRPPAAEPRPAPLWAQDGDPRVDINTATLAELVTLPGVGPVSAQRVLDERAEHGPFESAEELVRVPGFGPAKVRALADLVRAG